MTLNPPNSDCRWRSFQGFHRYGRRIRRRAEKSDNYIRLHIGWGRVHGQEDIEVFDGSKARSTLRAKLLLRSVDANIQATVVTVHGVLVGDTVASQSIYLDASAKVVGDLNAPSIVIEDGARIRGQVETGENGSASKPKAKRTPAAPAPRRAAKVSRTEESAPEPADEFDDDEPELPSSASKKKVAVKKRD